MLLAVLTFAPFRTSDGAVCINALAFNSGGLMDVPADLSELHGCD
jgi:hypothetical protein